MKIGIVKQRAEIEAHASKITGHSQTTFILNTLMCPQTKYISKIQDFIQKIQLPLQDPTLTPTFFYFQSSHYLIKYTLSKQLHSK